MRTGEAIRRPFVVMPSKPSMAQPESHWRAETKQARREVDRPELLRGVGIMLSGIASDAQTFSGSKGVNGAELPAGITCEGFASEYQPISASGSCARTLVAVAEHCCFLTRNQVGQQHNLTVWKFQRITMCVPDILVDLPEPRGGVVHGLRFPAEEPGSPDRSKGEFRSGKYTNRHVRVCGRSEPCGARVELVSCQFVTNLGRSRRREISALLRSINALARRH